MVTTRNASEHLTVMQQYCVGFHMGSTLLHPSAGRGQIWWRILNRKLADATGNFPQIAERLTD
ncbi:hypothetical protein YERSI8AC_260071 [Enterobacterales bacterium 8AC]|nr:hypothetical protein YERSI8AC_260071 [Enterobacterales bacterium 8AC]